MAEAAVANPRGWLRTPQYDLLLIVGVAVLALATGAAAVAWPELFPVLLFLDLWLLGYHHVISTFTRLAFDRESFARHRFLILGLPFVILAGAVGAVAVFGGWILATTYLYWQWFHYTRQAYGIERVYRRRANGTVPGHERATRWLIYAVPLWGILYRSWQAPSEFLGMELKTLPATREMVWASGAVALGLTAWWIFEWGRSIAAGAKVQGQSLFVASHLVIFVVGYVAIESIDSGWLVLNVWHNAQYILFVWHFNANRFREGVSTKSPFLSSLSQSYRWPWYFLTCLLISSVAYFGLDQALQVLQHRSTLPLFLVAYQTINFHHYVVDGLIWKVRKKPIQEALGLT